MMIYLTQCNVDKEWRRSSRALWRAWKFGENPSVSNGVNKIAGRFAEQRRSNVGAPLEIFSKLATKQNLTLTMKQLQLRNAVQIAFCRIILNL